jgi:hypothetical protein
MGDSKEPDILYYNASIVNNNTDDVGTGNQATLDPPIRFNETRDTPLIKDCSKYQFSIVRFIMNGANKDLPLFIPQIQSGTGQSNVNLTEYGFCITYDGAVTGGVVGYDNSTFTSTTPGLSYVIYEPETKNPQLAPLPRTTASPDYAGDYSATVVYQPGQIVYNGTNFYQRLEFSGSPVVNPPVAGVPTSDALYWVRVSPELGNPQDLSSKYYWVYTYSWWLVLVQRALETANNNCYRAYQAKATASLYATYTAWLAVNPTPIISFNENTNLFSISYPGTYLSVSDQTTQGFPSPNADTPVLSLYMNSNMAGLFSNFNNNYYNTPSPIYQTSGGVQLSRWYYGSTQTFPDGLTTLMIVKVNDDGNNLVVRKTVATTITPGSSPFPTRVVMTQNYLSTSTLWSPIDSIVFTTALIPIQNEAQAPPNTLGSKNTGNSASTSRSAFQPIITDVAFDLSSDPSAYRKMIYYSPQAEYRMTDFQNSKADIRSIDVQVYWRNRLDNNLYPVSMFNLSSVSIKIMFRKKGYLAKSEKYLLE